MDEMYWVEHWAFRLVAMTTVSVCCDNAFGLLSACQAKRQWNQLLWLWFKNLKSKSSHGKSIALAMFSSCEGLLRSCLSPGSNSKRPLLGCCGRGKVCSFNPLMFIWSRYGWTWFSCLDGDGYQCTAIAASSCFWGLWAVARWAARRAAVPSDDENAIVCCIDGPLVWCKFNLNSSAIDACVNRTERVNTNEYELSVSSGNKDCE